MAEVVSRSAPAESAHFASLLGCSLRIQHQGPILRQALHKQVTAIMLAKDSVARRQAVIVDLHSFALLVLVAAAKQVAIIEQLV